MRMSFCFVFLVMVTHAPAQADSWKGQEVIGKSKKTAIYDKSGKGRRTVGELTVIASVTEVEGDWLKVGPAGKETWVRADDVVLVRAAKEYFTKRLAEKQSCESYLQRAAVCRWLGDREGGLADTKEALKLDPKADEAWSLQAFLLVEKGELVMALACHDRAVELAPKKAGLYVNRGTFHWLFRGDNDKALADYAKALELDPGNEEVLVNRSHIWRVKNDLDKAIADCDTLLKRDPKNDTAYVNRGHLLAQKGDIDKAMADFDAALKLNPKSSHAFTARADLWEQKGDLDRAIQAYSEAIKLEPASAHLLIGRSRLWTKNKKDDKAIEDLDAAVAIDSKSVVVLLMRGTALVNAKKFDKALDDLDAALRLCTTGEPAMPVPGVVRAQILEQRALAFMSGKKEHAKALKDIDEAFTLHDTLPTATLVKAWILAACPDDKVRNGAKALELAKKLLEWDNQEPSYWKVLAAAHAEAGDFNEAVRCQTKAIELSGKDADAAELAKANERLKLYENKKPCRDKD